MNPVFVDHFRHPRHQGRLDAPDVEVEVSNPVCGDELRLGLGVAEGRIQEVAFQVRGCAGAIAAASALCELVAGATLAEARAVDRDHVDQALGGLPALKRHGADLAVSGLSRALEALEENA